MGESGFEGKGWVFFSLAEGFIFAGITERQGRFEPYMLYLLSGVPRLVAIGEELIKLFPRRLVHHRLWIGGVFSFLFMFSCVPSWSATYIWNGGGADANWSTGANWVGAIAPASNGTAA